MATKSRSTSTPPNAPAGDAPEVTGTPAAATDPEPSGGGDATDVKEQMRLALERKRAHQAAGRGAAGAAGAKIGAGSNRAVGGKREFRRKSGG